MNTERYLTMLRDKVWPIISAWDNIEDLISCKMELLHTLLLWSVREWLNAQFPGKWMAVVVVRTNGQPSDSVTRDDSFLRNATKW